MADIVKIVQRDDPAPKRLKRPPANNVVVVPMPAQLGTSWTVASVRAALDAHETGQFAASAALVDAMGRDDRIKGTLGTRVRALVGKNGLPFSIQGADVDKASEKRADELAQELEPHWWKICSDATMAALIRDVVMLGAHLSRIVWLDEDGMWLPQLRPVPAQNLFYDDSLVNGPEGYYVMTATQPVYVDPADPNWFLYTPAGPRAWLEGAVRALGMAFMMRQFSYRDWVRYSEKHGMPILTIEEPSDTPVASKDAFYKRLAKLGTETVVRMPVNKDGNGFKLGMLEAKDSSWQAFDTFIARLDVAIAVVLLGQNMTTDPQAHATGVNNARLVRQDYLDSDVQPLATALREHVIKPWGRYNIAGWDDTLAPWPDWDTRPPEDQKQKAATYAAVGEAITKMTDAGLPVDGAVIAEQFGIPLIAGDENAQRAGQFYKYHFDYGLITLNEGRARLGLPPVEGGDVPPKPVAAAQQPGAGQQSPPGDGSGTGREAHDHDHREAEETDLDYRAKADGFIRGQEYADKLATTARERARDAMAVDLDVLMAAIDGAKDYADLQARLLKAYRTMSADDLAAITEKALIMAELAGRYAVLEDV